MGTALSRQHILVGSRHPMGQILVLAHGKDWLRNLDNRVETRIDVDRSWQIAKLRQVERRSTLRRWLSH